MDAKIVRANVWGVPVKGTLVNINQADVGTITSATAGLSRSILGAGRAVGGGIVKAAAITVGAAALGLASIFVALMIAAVQENQRKHRFRIPIDSLAWVMTEGRNFYGVCLTPSVQLECADGQCLCVPLHSIDWLGRYLIQPFWGMGKRDFQIKTVDGSLYTGIKRFVTPEIQLMTLVGIQSIKLTDEWRQEKRLTFFGRKTVDFQLIQRSPFSITSTTIDQADSLREKLSYALSMNREKIVETIGEPIFHHYFSPLEP